MFVSLLGPVSRCSFELKKIKRSFASQRNLVIIAVLKFFWVVIVPEFKIKIFCSKISNQWEAFNLWRFFQDVLERHWFLPEVASSGFHLRLHSIKFRMLIANSRLKCFIYKNFLKHSSNRSWSHSRKAGMPRKYFPSCWRKKQQKINCTFWNFNRHMVQSPMLAWRMDVELQRNCRGFQPPAGSPSKEGVRKFLGSLAKSEVQTLNHITTRRK